MILKQTIPLFCVILLSYIGFSLALPIFPPLLLDPAYGMISPEFSKQFRNILLGLLMAMYPIGQFFGSPVLGKLSDRFGRKNILLVSLFAVIPSYSLTAISIQTSNLLLLFFSRFFSGILEGNFVIAQAAISDISKNHEEKTRYFGYLVSLTSAGFIIGPLLAGKLTDSQIVPWFSPSLPFWVTASFAILAFLLIALLFKETKAKDLSISIQPRKLLSSYFKGFHLKSLRPIYLVNFFIYTAIFFFFGFFPVFLVEQFHFSTKSLGYVESYLALAIFLAPLFFNIFTRFFVPKTVIKFVGFSLTVFLLIFLIPKSSFALFFTLPPLGFLCAMIFTFAAIMISDRADSHVQGEALGLNQSVQVFAEALTAMTGGILAGIYVKLPLLVGALSSLSGAFLLLFFEKKRAALISAKRGRQEKHL